jgi:hypothetical protein
VPHDRRRPRGRSTYGICFGLLGWRIDEGHAGGLDLAGLGGLIAGPLATMPEDQQAKYLFLNEVAQEVELHAATGVVVIADSWYVSPDVEIPYGMRPSDMIERLGLETLLSEELRPVATTGSIKAPSCVVGLGYAAAADRTGLRAAASVMMQTSAVKAPWPSARARVGRR